MSEWDEWGFGYYSNAFGLASEIQESCREAMREQRPIHWSFFDAWASRLRELARQTRLCQRSYAKK